MRRLLTNVVFFGLIGLAAFWFTTRPKTLADNALDGLTADASRGEMVFHATGCASCHTDPNAHPEEGELPVLAGGQKFPSDFGTFLAPNISPDPTHGIGDWSTLDLANAMKHGTSPEGQHYYPAFPYTSYNKATLQDIVDLKAYLDTLPASQAASLPHEVGFPFNIRLSLGGWKFLFDDDSWVADATTPQEERGRYLVEALGHCAECHTPRNAIGGLDRDNWLAGAPDASGSGNIPAINPERLTWSEGDLNFYFETGFTPDYDSAGGHMSHVIKNLAQLPPEDRAAITAYLKALPTGS